MSLLRSFVLMECAVSIVDTSSGPCSSTVKWTPTPPISRWPATASTISSLQKTASTISDTDRNGCRPSAATSTKTTTFRLVGLPWTATEACCVARKAYDKRTPGLFKVEWRGDGFIGLCSKTYYCFGATDKSTSKGLNKRQNDIDKDKFLAVLTNRRSGSGVNRGFRVHNSSMMTYVQERATLTYFYPKRKVLADGLSTAPLDL